MEKLNLEKLILVAKAGFPKLVQSQIDFTGLSMQQKGNAFLLYRKSDQGIYLKVEIWTGGVQFNTGTTSFNQLTAIDKLRSLKIIK